MVGAISAFFVSRYFIKGWVIRKFKSRKWFKKNFDALNAIITERGITAVFLIRLSILPFGPMSYFLGVTNIKLYQYVLGSFGMIFHIIQGTFFGSKLFDHELQNSKSDEVDNYTTTIIII